MLPITEMEESGLSFNQAVTLCLLAPADDPIILVGPPGEGKSQIPQEVAKRLKAAYWPLYTGTMESVEIRGLPHLYERHGKKYGAWGPFEGVLPLQGEDHTGHIVINPDDIAQSAPIVQKAVIRSFYGDGFHRMVGTHELYSDVRIIGTSNLQCHRAGAHRFETWVTGRCNIVPVRQDPIEWVSNFAIPNGIHPSISAFVRQTRTISDFAPEKDQFMSARSLTKLSPYLYALDHERVNGQIMRACVYGKIGKQKGSEFLAYHALADKLPDMDAVLDGQRVTMPLKPEVQYMFVTSLLTATKEQHTRLIVPLIEQLSETGATGFEVAAFLTFECLKGSAKHLRNIRSDTQFWSGWFTKYSKYLP